MRVTSGFWGERVLQVSTGLSLPANALDKYLASKNKDLCILVCKPHIQRVLARVRWVSRGDRQDSWDTAGISGRTSTPHSLQNKYSHFAYSQTESHFPTSGKYHLWCSKSAFTKYSTYTPLLHLSLTCPFVGNDLKKCGRNAYWQSWFLTDLPTMCCVFFRSESHKQPP